MLAETHAQMFISGTSAGGMMLHNLLCTSSVVGRHISAAVDLIGGVGTALKPECHPTAKVPLRILHGETDSVLPFERGAEVDGAPFISTSEAPTV